MTSDATPQMPSISFSAHGILENLVVGKAPGPDGLTIICSGWKGSWP